MWSLENDNWLGGKFNDGKQKGTSLSWLSSWCGSPTLYRDVWQLVSQRAMLLLFGCIFRDLTMKSQSHSRRSGSLLLPLLSRSHLSRHMKGEKLISLGIEFFPPNTCLKHLYSQQARVTLHFGLLPVWLWAAKKNQKTEFSQLFYLQRHSVP